MKNIHFNTCMVFLWILFFSFASKNSWAATKTWTGAAGTDWTIGSNWGGTAPASGDDALIPGGLVNYPIINNSVTIRNITINNTGSGAKVTITTGGSLTATGIITINANGTFTMISGIAALSGITSSGAIDIQGGTITSTVNITVSGTLAQSGGTVWMAANTSTNPTDNLVISGGTVNQSAGTIYTKDYSPTNGTFNQTGSGAIVRIFHDWKPDSGHTFNSTNGTVQFSGSGGGGPDFSSPNTQFFNVVVDAAVNPSFDNTANSLVQIRSNFTNHNLGLNNSINATFTFNGTGTQTLTSASTGTNNTFGNLIINKSGGSATHASTINTAGNLTVTQGIYDIANFNSSAGAVTLINGAISGTTGVLTGTSYQMQSGSISAILAGAGSLTKTTTGTVLLSGNNTYSGTTTISVGILAIAASGVIADNSAIILNGGTFSTGNTTGWNETVGTLTVNANSTISLSSGIHILSFDVSTGIATSVTVTGWTGGYNGTSGTAGKIKFGSSVSGLTSAQLGQIRFYNGSNYYAATILSDGEVVPTSVFHAPNSLSYSSPNYFTNGIEITPLSPAITGFVESYGISPAIPAGLTINTSTGIISGIPTVNSTLNYYTITASNISGSTTFIISIAVGSTITTGGSGNWSSTISNRPWPGGIVPKAWDRVLIKNGHTVTVDINNAACASIELCSGGGIANLNFSGTSPSLTVFNNIDIGGPVNNNRTGIITFTSNAILSAGSLSLNKNLNGTSYSEINMTAGGTLQTGSFIIGGTGTTALWIPGAGTVQMTATNTLPATIFTDFNNLQINTGTTTTGVAIATLKGSLTVIAGATFVLNHPVGATTAPTITILEWGQAGSSLTGSGTLTLGGPVNVNYVANGSIDAKISVLLALGATRTFTVAGDGATITTGLTVSSVIGGSALGIAKSGAGTMALSGTNTFTGGTTLNTGSLNINNSQALGTVAGTFTINGGLINNTSGGTLTTANYPLAWNGDFTFTGTDPLNLGTGIVTLNANRQVTILANTLTVGGPISSGSYNLTKAGIGTLSFESNVITLNGLSLNAGTLVSTSGNMSLAGTFSNNGIFIHNFGTVNFNGISNQSIPAVNFYNLTSSSNGNRTLASSGSIGIAGTFIPGSNMFATTGSTVDFNGNADQTVPSFTFHNLSLSTGGIKSIQPNGQVTVSGIVTSNLTADKFIIKSTSSGTASLIHNTNNVPATVERHISGASEAWHFLSSPVAAQSISGSWLPSGTYGNGTGYDLYAWNESTNCWIYKLDITSPVNWNTIHPEANFIPERGYLYSVQATNPTKEFAGNLNNGTIGYGLTFGSNDPNLQGFNLVGNPYPSSVDWQAASGWTRTALANSGGGYDVWIWNPAANNYGIFNSATGLGTNAVTRYIAPMQGYFVRAASAGNLTLDNTVRVHDGASVWKNAAINPEKFSMIVKSEADSSSDESLLLFGYRSDQSGAAKLFSPISTAPGLYLNSGDKSYSVRYLTDTIDYPAVPVMFKAGRDGNYTLSCNFDDDQFKIVLLEDRKTHKIQNMKATATSHFSALKTDDVNRFVLHFGVVKDDSKKEFPGKIYADDSRLIVDLTLVSEDTEVFVYDLMGRKLFQQKLQGRIQHNLILNANTQILIFSLKNPKGNISQKLLWINNEL